MDLSGKWKIAAALSYDEDAGAVWKTVDEFLAETDEEEDKRIFDAIFIFSDDGMILTTFPLTDDIPKDEIDELIAAGEIEMYGDDMIVLEKKPWELRADKLYFDSGVEGEILGEATDPWVEMPVFEDGSIQLATYRLAKI